MTVRITYIRVVDLGLSSYTLIPAVGQLIASVRMAYFEIAFFPMCVWDGCINYPGVVKVTQSECQ